MLNYMADFLFRLFGVYPFIEPAQTADDRNKQYQHHPEGMGSGFEQSPDHQTPPRARQILDLQEPKTADGDPDPENIADQIRAEQIVSQLSPDGEADDPADDADQSDAESQGLVAFDFRRRRVIRVHQLLCPPEAGAGVCAG